MKESKSDLWTLVAIAAFSLILATMLHEHVGHALACFSLGGHLNELGAFYVDCQYDSVTNFGARTTRVAKMLPRTDEGRYVSQLIRSGLAAAPNYAEARAAESRADWPSSTKRSM